MRNPVLTYFVYDGEMELPEEGVAIHSGRPHYFWLRDPLPVLGTAVFDIVPIDQPFLEAVSEFETIWREWDLAYHAGEVELSTHPGIQGNNLRFLELQEQIATQAEDLHSAAHQQRGLVKLSERYLAEARRHGGKKWPIPGMRSAELEIVWQVP